MWVHFLLLALVLSAIFLQKIIAPNSKKQRIVITLIFIVFFVFITFRAYTVGNDTPEYYRLFKLVNAQSSIVTASGITRYEIGYIALNYLIGRFTDNFTVLIGLITAFYLISSMYLVKRYARSVGTACVLMFTLSLFYLAINLERQCIAMGIFYLAIPLLERKRRLLYCLMIILAASFHMASIVLIVLAFLPPINFSDKKVFRRWVVISLAGLVLVNYGIELILRFFPYFEHYYTNSIYSEGGVRSASVALFAIRLGIVILTMVVGCFKYQNNDSSEAVSIFNKMMFFDVVLAAASIGFNIFDRLEKYFTLGFIVAIVNALYFLDNSEHARNNKTIASAMIIILSFAYVTATLFLRSSWTGIFPYSFI